MFFHLTGNPLLALLQNNTITFIERNDMKLENYVLGLWLTGDAEWQALYDAFTGETIAHATTKGLDFNSILQYGREVGNTSLRKLSFHERGRMLKALAIHLLEKKEKFYSISYRSGATK